MQINISISSHSLRRSLTFAIFCTKGKRDKCVASKSDCHRHPQLHVHPRTHPRVFSHTNTYTTAYAIQTSIYRKIRDPKRAVMRNLDLEFHYYRYILRQIFNSRECTVQIFVLYSLTYLQGKEGRFFFLLLITWKI